MAKGTKVERYNWSDPGSQGEFRLVEKTLLCVDGSYQRIEEQSEEKVRILTAQFLWSCFGILIVSQRPDGTLWILDGMHRHSASVRRDDVQRVPCLVFRVSSAKEEAELFLKINRQRRAMGSPSVFRAENCAEFDTATFVASQLKKYGISVVKTPTKGSETKSIGTMMRMAKADKDAFEIILKVAHKLCVDADFELRSDILKVLGYMHQYVKGSLTNERLVDALITTGGEAIIGAMNREKQVQGIGGERVMAFGLLKLLNKTARPRFVMQ